MNSQPLFTYLAFATVISTALNPALVSQDDQRPKSAERAKAQKGKGVAGMHRVGFPAPSLDGFWDRPIASGPNFEYSAALTNARHSGNEQWTPELLDQFLADLKRFAPGTKMEFQGLLNEEDRKALIEHLTTSR